MQHDHRHTVWISALLYIDTVTVPYIQQALVVRFNIRVKPPMCVIVSDWFVHAGDYIGYKVNPPWGAAQKTEGTMTVSTIDPAEVAKFEAMAAEWWDPNGKFKPLHMLNPCRLDYITRQIAAEFDRDLTAPVPFKGLRLLDIGCGGGLLSEPMARLGADVVGADAAERNIPVAQIHAEQEGLQIDYRHTTAEDMAAAGEQFDVVLNMEVVEHVADPLAYLIACQQLLKPGGLMICSTLNRNPKSYLMAIIGAEYVMRWLPKGTHEWSKFITPDELYDLIRRAGLDPVDRTGFVFDKLRWSWSLSERDLSVNYVTASVKPGA
jgi:2-polyprenyl-6-hydroxyphenyl methylase/3-demethylubiquinone-9 3-methyltransferase